MNRQEIHIPIPEKSIAVKLPGHTGTFFLDPDPVKSEFTYVDSGLGTDGASYKFTSDQVIITSYFTHDRSHDIVETVFENPSDSFWELQEMLQELISKAEERTVPELRQLIEENGLFGSIYRNIGLPDPENKIPLRDNHDEGKPRRHVKIYKGEDGSLVVSKFTATDLGMGMDTDFFEGQEFHIDPDGTVKKITNYYPQKPAKEDQLSSEESEKIVKSLGEIVDSAVQLKKEGKLTDVAKNISILWE